MILKLLALCAVLVSVQGILQTCGAVDGSVLENYGHLCYAQDTYAGLCDASTTFAEIICLNTNRDDLMCP